ncbi:MAG: DMT family transporter, partial [Bacteroides sp.]
EHLSRTMIAAIAIAIGGVWLLSTGNNEGIVSNKGITMVFITVVAYGSYIVGVNQSCANRVDGLIITFYVLTFTAVFCGINVLAQGRGLDNIPNIHTGINLVLLAFIPTLISNLFLILAIHKVGSTITAVLGCMEPLTAICIGVLFLGESIATIQYVGIAVIIVAVALVILSRNRCS